jgi:putative ABC transport system permease protein
MNLVNMTVSRIFERSSEIGVRKAFGASVSTLVWQFVVENVVLTLVGGALAVIFSLVALDILNDSGVMPFAHFALNLYVLLYGLLITLFFGVFSGVLPAYRMSRLHPVEALRGVTT